MKEIRSSVMKVLELLGASFDHKITPALAEAWHLGLAELTEDQLAQGVKRLLKNKKESWMPTVGEFVEWALLHEGSADLDEEAAFEFGLLLRELDSWSSAYFKNPVTAECARRMGGWRAVCSWKTDEIPFRKKEFCGLYRSLKLRGGDFDRYLPGATQQVRLIGDFDRLERCQARLEANKRRLLGSASLPLPEPGGSGTLPLFSNFVGSESKDR